MKKLIFAASLIACIAAPAMAQKTDNLTLGAQITNTARVPGTVSVLGKRNDNSKGVSCTFNQTAEVGSPSTVIKIEAQDSASGTWQALGTSSAVTTGSATIQVYPGAVATSVPSGMTVVGLKVPAIWRVTQVITGGTSTTGTVGCDLLD